MAKYIRTKLVFEVSNKDAKTLKEHGHLYYGVLGSGTGDMYLESDWLIGRIENAVQGALKEAAQDVRNEHERE